MATYLKSQWKKGVYKNLKDPTQLATQLDADLQRAHRDPHQTAMRVKQYLVRSLRELLAQSVEKLLDGRYEWLEDGIIGYEEMGKAVREAVSKAG